MNTIINYTPLMKVIIKQKTIPCEITDNDVTIIGGGGAEGVTKTSQLINDGDGTNPFVTEDQLSIFMKKSDYDSDNNLIVDEVDLMDGGVF